ncbi:MAG: hypothetical protein EXR49_06210 [Dehalococcoidia bacterium]|nr:hypothetical protein [Dehalococcoidia bacterium]
MPKGIYLIFTECTDPSREEEFNRWYSRTHLPDLSAAQGWVRSRRFVNLRPNDGPSAYLAAYEFDSPDIEASIADQRSIARETVTQGRHIDCLRAVRLSAFQEIDPRAHPPLERLDYPRVREAPPGQR